jgi:hypothetical protein
LPSQNTVKLVKSLHYPDGQEEAAIQTPEVNLFVSHYMTHYSGDMYFGECRIWMGSFISRPKIFLNFMVDELVYLARGIDSVIHFVAEERARGVSDSSERS